MTPKHCAARRRFVCAAAAAALAAASGAAGAPPATPRLGQASRDSVWVPTPPRLVRRMMQIADVGPEDLVVDLGSGDGRIPIYGARHFGARGLGVELEENLVRVAEEAAHRAGVAERVRFVRGDLFTADLAGATVIALYLGEGVMARLAPRLASLSPGTRIVSHQFGFPDWTPDETIRVEDRSAHLWVVPAPVAGRWAVAIEGEDFVLDLAQRRQELTARAGRKGRPLHVLAARLRGTEIRFASFDRDGSARQYEGTVAGDRMEGESYGEDVPARRWRAVRLGSLG